MNLNEYFNSGVDFNVYCSEIENIINNGDEDDKMYKYYGLNLQRINRLIKKFQLSDEHLDELNSITENFKLIVITEGWCGDAAQIIPVLEKIQKATDKIEIRMVYRDQNLDLMNRYLTNGSMSIPIIVGISETGEEQFRWGPRPAFGMELLKKYKSGEISKEEFSVDLQKTYNKDKGNAIFDELINLMK